MFYTLIFNNHGILAVRLEIILETDTAADLQKGRSYFYPF